MKIGSGTRWTDVLTEIDALILHERVCAILAKEKFTGFKIHPIEITEVKSKKLVAVPIPRYYFVEITGRVDIDINELDDEGGSICPVCLARNASEGNPYRWKAKRIVPKLETWDGSDFIKLSNLRSGRNFCSRRFVELAHAYKWTNFVFGESLPGVGLWEKAPQFGLSYFDPEWFAKLGERVRAKYPDLF